MKSELQIKAIAELDGWTFIPSYDSSVSGNAIPEHWIDEYGDRHWKDKPFLSYITSRDAIMPVIEKQNEDVKTKIVVRLATDIDGSWITDRVLFATPSQLCEALLRATGKWID